MGPTRGEKRERGGAVGRPAPPSAAPRLFLVGAVSSLFLYARARPFSPGARTTPRAKTHSPATHAAATTELRRRRAIALFSSGARRRTRGHSEVPKALFYAICRQRARVSLFNAPVAVRSTIGRVRARRALVRVCGGDPLVGGVASAFCEKRSRGEVLPLFVEPAAPSRSLAAFWHLLSLHLHILSLSLSLYKYDNTLKTNNPSTPSRTPPWPKAPRRRPQLQPASTPPPWLQPPTSGPPRPKSAPAPPSATAARPRPVHP